MIARHCTNPKCNMVSPLVTCPTCDAETRPLPTMELGALGLDAKASLHWGQTEGYFLVIDKPSGAAQVPVGVCDTSVNNQLGLPGFDLANGLQIMDSVKTAATMISQKSPNLWPGWIFYLIERLQKATNEHHYQALLQALIEELRAKRLHE